jgi:hypothetical protein
MIDRKRLRNAHLRRGAGISVTDKLRLKWNLEMIGVNEDGSQELFHQRTHNIVVNNGRQSILENIAASSLSVGSFTRTRNTVIRYMGIGIGGNRQLAPEAAASPLADAYPDGYGGSNAQTDVDPVVGRIERPIKATASLWLKEVAAPATFPTATSVRWQCLFDSADLNLSPYTSIPISEVGLYWSSADPTLPNGGAGSYPGPTGHLAAYDNYFPLYKTAFFSILVRWTWVL